MFVCVSTYVFVLFLKHDFERVVTDINVQHVYCLIKNES